ncbi:MAG TPA: aldo/keto reductase [Gemmatimonadaceae bacterium]|nr:aldo/keto reductase [Gemmatimonadaceae bacterium]
MPPTLPQRQLGTTDMNITRVGFGAWATGGGEWGPQNDESSLAAMSRAIDAGVNWIDTAPIYGHGHSEEVVKRFLAGRRGNDRPYVFTKCGLVWDPKNRDDVKRVLTPQSIRRECEASLRRLGVERIDLYQFHWPDDSTDTPAEASWRVMETLQQEGKVRACAVSNFDVSLLRRIDALHHVQSLQPPLSLIRRDAAAAEIPWCHAHRTGVIVYSPQQAGLLTDSFSMERLNQLAPEDWRKKSAHFQTPHLEKNLSLREALRPIAKRHETTVGAIAVAWTLAWPGVTGAIVGARSADQVEGWLAAATLSLTAADLEDIAKAIEKTGAGTGPARPPLPREKTEARGEVSARI